MGGILGLEHDPRVPKWLRMGEFRAGREGSGEVGKFRAGQEVPAMAGRLPVMDHQNDVAAQLANARG
jgi:hypothetical protein